MAAENKMQLEAFSWQAADSLSVHPWGYSPALACLPVPGFTGVVLEAAFVCCTEMCSGAELCSVLVHFPDQNQNTKADSRMYGLCLFC